MKQLPKIQQETKWSCALACIESILSAAGNGYSQTQMIQNFYKCIPDWDEYPGKTAPAYFEAIFEKAGVPVTMEQPDTPRETIERFPSCLGGIVSREKLWVDKDGIPALIPNFHAVALLDASATGFKILNPGYPPYQSVEEIWSIKDMVDFCTRTYLFFEKEAG